MVSNLYNLSQNPLVSVIIPAYNAQAYIDATLASLKCQSYQNLEIIIIDDGSCDQTALIAKSWMKKDKRIRFFRQSNQGVALARNKAIQHSKGEYIVPVDADDICFPKKIEKLISCIEKSGKRVGLVYSWYANIDQQGKLTGSYHSPQIEGDVYKDLLFSNFLGNGSNCLIRKNCFDTVGLYNTNFSKHKAQGCEDYELYLRIAERFEFKVVKAFLTGYRISDDTMSTDFKTMEKSRLLVYRILRNRNPEIPPFVLRCSLAYFYLYLSSRADAMGFYKNSTKYLLKAAIYDKALLSNIVYLRKLFVKIMQANSIPKRPMILLKEGLMSRFSPSQNIQNKNDPIERLLNMVYLFNQESSLRLLREKRRNSIKRFSKTAKKRKN